MADETEMLEVDQTLALDRASFPVKNVVKVDYDQLPPEAPNLEQPQRYRRKGVVTAVQYTGTNRQVLMEHAGAYVVHEDDALVVMVDGKNQRLFPGDVALLRLGSKDDDEKCEGVVGAAVWAAEYELV